VAQNNETVMSNSQWWTS